jgi:hypothetical protein
LKFINFLQIVERDHNKQSTPRRVERIICQQGIWYSGLLHTTMKLFQTCLLAALSLAATAPGTAIASTITADQLLKKSHAPGFTFSTNNILGAPDDGGRYLNQAWTATGQSFIKLRMEQAFTQDGTSARDLKIVNFSEIANNGHQAAAIWVIVEGTAYNVGTHRSSAVWGDPKGGASAFGDGWVVFGGNKGGKIDLDFFFGESGIYGTFSNLAISNLYVSGYYEDGVTTQNYDLDAVKAFTAATTAVPIPAAMWLFASGLLGLIATGRKRNI